MVLIGDKGNKVSAPMKVSDYIDGYGDLLYSKRFAEIERHGGALVLQEENGEERNNREGA